MYGNVWLCVSLWMMWTSTLSLSMKKTDFLLYGQSSCNKTKLSSVHTHTCFQDAVNLFSETPNPHFWIIQTDILIWIKIVWSFSLKPESYADRLQICPWNKEPFVRYHTIITQEGYDWVVFSVVYLKHVFILSFY